MKKFVIVISGLLMSAMAFAANPPNLIDIYHAALENDPQFQQALANRDIAQQNLPLATAALLPQINLTGTGEYEKTSVNGGSTVNTSADSTGTTKARNLGFNVSLTQTIFNFTNWMNVASARQSVKAAYATYTAAVQTLIQQTVTAYFNVLLAEATLRYTEAEKRAFYRQYIQAEKSYEVGIKTITDVYNAKASYESSVADYVGAQNAVKDRKEDLAAITGHYYKKIAGLRKLPLAKPAPADINQWTKTAIKYNWSLTAAQYTMLSDHSAIKAAFGGHLPSLAFDGTFNNTYTNNFGGIGNNREKTTDAQLNLSVPVYSGGEVTAQVKQAIAQYDLAAGQYEQTYRSTVSNTRQSYLGAISGISQVKADKEAIVSNQSTLKGMEEGYKVGTQTMTDVLIAQKNLYDSQRQFANDEYKYVISLVDLKLYSGLLNVDDVSKLNSYLMDTASERTIPAKT